MEYQLFLIRFPLESSQVCLCPDVIIFNEPLWAYARSIFPNYQVSLIRRRQNHFLNKLTHVDYLGKKMTQYRGHYYLDCENTIMSPLAYKKPGLQ